MYVITPSFYNACTFISILCKIYLHLAHLNLQRLSWKIAPFVGIFGMFRHVSMQNIYRLFQESSDTFPFKIFTDFSRKVPTLFPAKYLPTFPGMFRHVSMQNIHRQFIENIRHFSMQNICRVIENEQK